MDNQFDNPQIPPSFNQLPQNPVLAEENLSGPFVSGLVGLILSLISTVIIFSLRALVFVIPYILVVIGIFYLLGRSKASNSFKKTIIFIGIPALVASPISLVAHFAHAPPLSFLNYLIGIVFSLYLIKRYYNFSWKTAIFFWIKGGIFAGLALFVLVALALLNPTLFGKLTKLTQEVNTQISSESTNSNQTTTTSVSCTTPGPIPANITGVTYKNKYGYSFIYPSSWKQHIWTETDNDIYPEFQGSTPNENLTLDLGIKNTLPLSTLEDRLKNGYLGNPPIPYTKDAITVAGCQAGRIMYTNKDKSGFAARHITISILGKGLNGSDFIFQASCIRYDNIDCTTVIDDVVNNFVIPTLRFD